MWGALNEQAALPCSRDKDVAHSLPDGRGRRGGAERTCSCGSGRKAAGKGGELWALGRAPQSLEAPHPPAPAPPPCPSLSLLLAKWSEAGFPPSRAATEAKCDYLCAKLDRSPVLRFSIFLCFPSLSLGSPLSLMLFSLSPQTTAHPCALKGRLGLQSQLSAPRDRHHQPYCVQRLAVGVTGSHSASRRLVGGPGVLPPAGGSFLCQLSLRLPGLQRL